MTVLPVQIAGAAVTFSLGLYLAVALIFCAAPVLDAIMERRRPALPDLSVMLECLGVALAIAGFAVGATGLAAIGVVVTMVVVARNSGRISEAFDPTVHAAMLVCGLVSLGALAEFHYFMA